MGVRGGSEQVVSKLNDVDAWNASRLAVGIGSVSCLALRA